MYLPAGNDNTPAPTILLIRLKTSLGIVAVPPPPPPRGTSEAKLAAVASFPRRVDDGICAEVVTVLLMLLLQVPVVDLQVGVNNASDETMAVVATTTTAIHRRIVILVAAGDLIIGLLEYLYS